jgi:hypothetical protein
MAPRDSDSSLFFLGGLKKPSKKLYPVTTISIGTIFSRVRPRRIKTWPHPPIVEVIIGSTTGTVRASKR